MKKYLLTTLTLALALICTQVQAQVGQADMGIYMEDQGGSCALGDSIAILIIAYNNGTQDYPINSMEVTISAPSNGTITGPRMDSVNDPNWTVHWLETSKTNGNAIKFRNTTGPLVAGDSCYIFINMVGYAVTDPIAYVHSSNIVYFSVPGAIAGNTNITNDNNGSAFMVYQPNPASLDFLSISADWKDEKAKVSWTVENERETDYFEIESSLDARNFKVIGKTQSIGNHVEAYTYNFIDEEASIHSAATRYYRVREFDKEGNNSYSDVVRLAGKEAVSIKNGFYPNPSWDKINLDYEYDSDKSADLQVKIINIAGQIVFVDTREVHPGMTKLTFDISPFAEGVYNVIYTNNVTGKVETQSFTKRSN